MKRSKSNDLPFLRQSGIPNLFILVKNNDDNDYNKNDVTGGFPLNGLWINFIAEYTFIETHIRIIYRRGKFDCVSC